MIGSAFAGYKPGLYLCIGSVMNPGLKKVIEHMIKLHQKYQSSILKNSVIFCQFKKNQTTNLATKTLKAQSKLHVLC